MAKAPAGMTGGLSITDMRELMRATDEIDTLAGKTAKQIKVVTDRTDDCRRLLESYNSVQELASSALELLQQTGELQVWVHGHKL